MKTVSRTLMPALWADRREPPTARMCQPGPRAGQHDMGQDRNDDGDDDAEREAEIEPSPMKSHVSDVTDGIG